MNMPIPVWEQRLRSIALVIGRLTLAYLFFTQLFWKMPPTFGCPPDFKFTTADADGILVRAGSLCDSISVGRGGDIVKAVGHAVLALLEVGLQFGIILLHI